MLYSTNEYKSVLYLDAFCFVVVDAMQKSISVPSEYWLKEGVTTE